MVVSVGVVAAVVELLSSRSRKLLVRRAEEAKVDDLTGLLNRRGFAEGAEAELARARREGTWLGVVSFDLDHFKAINDEFGTMSGTASSSRRPRRCTGPSSRAATAPPRSLSPSAIRERGGGC